MEWNTSTAEIRRGLGGRLERINPVDNEFFANYMKSAIRWRYLDSFDSLRLSEHFARGLELPRRKLHAKPTFFLTLLMGHGVVVPDNQLVDSVAFIPWASELIRAASKAGKFLFLPIRLAHYRSSDPFEIAAKIFEDQHFYLSGWPSLQHDEHARRAKWAPYWRNKDSLPEKLIAGPDEDRRATDLYLLLDFFYQHPANKLQAKKIGDLRTRLLRYLIDVSQDELDKLFMESHLSDEQATIVTDIILVLRNVNASRSDFPLPDRSAILAVLNDRADVAFKKISSPVFINECKKGVLKVVESAYNYSNSVATGAVQDDATEEMGQVFQINISDEGKNGHSVDWGYEEAAYFLGNWVRQKHVEEKKEKANDLVSVHDFKFESILTEEQYEQVLQSLSWDDIVLAWTLPGWQASVKKYLDALDFYEQAISVIEVSGDASVRVKRKAESAKGGYLQALEDHLRFIREKLPLPQTSIHETGDGDHVLTLRTPEGRVVAEATIENYAQNLDESQRDTVLRYSGEKTSNSDVKGVISEL